MNHKGTARVKPINIMMMLMLDSNSIGFIRRLLIMLLLGDSVSSFSFNAHHHRRIPLSLVRHHQSNNPFLMTTIRNSSPTSSSDFIEDTQSTSNTTELSIDIHPPTIHAIAQGLFVRAQNIKSTPLRYVDEEWEKSYSAGKIAQQAVDEWQTKQQLNPTEHEELLQIMAGRIVAVLARLDELEEELLKRCCKCETAQQDFTLLGVPDEELKVWQVSGDDQNKMKHVAEAIDAICLFDETIRSNRARTLLAMFLHEIEGPGLRRNGIVIPCMEIDFLLDEAWDILFTEDDITDSSGTETSVAGGDNTTKSNEQPERPSLHPIAITAIEEGIRLRAQNSTTSPFRIINDETEWYEVQYNIASFTERFLEKHTKSSSEQWTDEELQTIGGRIAGVLMRLDDLEWEWNNRVCSSTLVKEIDSSMWKLTLGLYPENECTKTIDTALLNDKEFARARAEKMLALFLMLLEGPGLLAAGESLPGGSFPSFITDEYQLELMQPKQSKQ